MLRRPRPSDDAAPSDSSRSQLLNAGPVQSMTPSQGREEKGYLVHGRVQGVGFRWSTTQKAKELGLRGTVRNRPDGTVEVHAKGAGDALARLRDWLGEGPRAARVEKVEEISPRSDFPEGFRIVR